MLTELQLRDFRCFEGLRIELAEGFNFVVGKNGEGKTSILEAACVLLRLQSQRSSSLAPLVRQDTNAFSVAGQFAGHRLEFRYSPLRRKLSFDDVAQRTTAEYLRVGRVVSLANTDIELARGAGEFRRRFLDFLGVQILPLYRPALRSYERALRSRNALLKSLQPKPRELAAYDVPLLEHGTKLSSMRAQLVERLAPLAAIAHSEISGGGETLAVRFCPGNPIDFAAALVASRSQEARLRQTVVGPHRDDLELLVDSMPASDYASEGQQRTVALALKIAQARVFAADEGTPPVLLIDDIFGELDPERRNALLGRLPADSQKLVTVTTMQWNENRGDWPVFGLEGGKVERL